MAMVFAIFALGLAVTLVIAKGMMQAADFAKKELDRLDNGARDEKGDL